jgi:hypothetical protein
VDEGAVRAGGARRSCPRIRRIAEPVPRPPELIAVNFAGGGPCVSLLLVRGAEGSTAGRSSWSGAPRDHAGARYPGWLGATSRTSVPATTPCCDSRAGAASPRTLAGSQRAVSRSSHRRTVRSRPHTGSRDLRRRRSRRGRFGRASRRRSDHGRRGAVGGVRTGGGESLVDRGGGAIEHGFSSSCGHGRSWRPRWSIGGVRETSVRGALGP